MNCISSQVAISLVQTNIEVSTVLYQTNGWIYVEVLWMHQSAIKWELRWWLILCSPNVGGLGSIPGQGTRSHTTQLRVCMLELKKKKKNKKTDTTCLCSGDHALLKKYYCEFQWIPSTFQKKKILLFYISGTRNGRDEKPKTCVLREAWFHWPLGSMVAINSTSWWCCQLLSHCVKIVVYVTVPPLFVCFIVIVVLYSSLKMLSS